MRRSWDTLPKRLLKEAVEKGPTKGSVNHLDEPLDVFYQICGWDIETGIPIPKNFNKSRLNDIAIDMQRCLDAEYSRSKK